MRQTRLKTRSKTSPTPSAAAAKQLIRNVGRLVRLGRAKRGITRRQLAKGSKISERYLAQIESGQGNPSVIVLKAIAQALDMPVVDLLPREGENDPALTRAIDVFARVPRSELAAMTKTVERRLSKKSAPDRARRIALVGLRGAGKSTLGRMLAQELGCPFVELDRVIELDYGASASMLIEMSGVGAFRRYERACLNKVIAKYDAAVIAVAGGIVADPETYALLLARTHSIWIKAQPQEHMRRVIAQGDFRPMAENREAMADLIAILEARDADYARAESELDTSGQYVEASFAKLRRLARKWQ
jgi:XRE family aerobic/anaerobic benzoate catabolism transcriptional regulator